MAIMSRMCFLLFVSVSAVQLPSAEEDGGDSLGLPDVDDMLSAADESVSELTKKADLIQAVTVKAQKARKTALTEIRDKYELKLAEVETTNRQTEADINALQEQIAAQKLANKDKRDNLTADERVSRSLNLLLDKTAKQLSSALVFLDQAMNNSNISDTKAALKAIHAPEKIDMASFVEKMASDKLGDDDEVILLQMAPTVVHRAAEQAKPEAILEIMSSGLANLTAAQDEGETRLKARFLATYELLTQTQAKLFKQRDELTKDLQALRVEQHELIKGKDTVDNTKADIAARLGGLRHFYENNIALIQTQLANAANALERPARNATA